MMVERRVVIVAVVAAALLGLAVGMAFGVFDDPAAPAASRQPGAGASPSAASLPAHGPARDKAYVVISLASPSLALSVADASEDDGADVIAFSRNDAENQRWRLLAAGQDEVQLRSVDSHLCLHARGKGARLSQRTCAAVDAQRWRLAAAGGGFSLVNVKSGLALGLRGDDGGRLAQVDPDPTDRDQLWGFSRIG
jgi:hypothetical protein